jgi:hypothetical protein
MRRLIRLGSLRVPSGVSASRGGRRLDDCVAHTRQALAETVPGLTGMEFRIIVTFHELCATRQKNQGEDEQSSGDLECIDHGRP